MCSFFILKYLFVLFFLYLNMGCLRGYKIIYGNYGIFEKLYVGYVCVVFLFVDKNDNNSYVNLENFEEYFL